MTREEIHTATHGGENPMQTNVLDHGYLTVIESWGSDRRIVETARMSTGKGFLGWDPGPCPGCCPQDQTAGDPACKICDGRGKHRGDSALLKFLADNHHDTPFEFAGLQIEVQAPICVFREWHRHRTQAFSEHSARYAPLPSLHYMPTPERCMRSNAANKQANSATGAPALELDGALAWLVELAELYENAERVYQSGLSRGVPKELARLANPVGRYSKMRAQANLRNWLGFVTLRSAPNAQEEIRVFSDVLADELRTAFPRTLALFDGKTA